MEIKLTFIDANGNPMTIEVKMALARPDHIDAGRLVEAVLKNAYVIHAPSET